MHVIPFLASSLGRRDEVPNQELAQLLIREPRPAAILELVDLLEKGKKAQKHDAVKILYEIGEKAPDQISPHSDAFLQLLKSKDNRLMWGAMMALHFISKEHPQEVFQHISEIVEAIDKGSVITRDHGVGILIQLSHSPKMSKTTFPLLMEQLRTSPDNQFPKYCEESFAVVAANEKPAFEALLQKRLGQLPKASAQKRVEKVLKGLQAF